MRAPRPSSRHTAQIVCGVLASLLGLAAACRNDDDHTDVCLGPGCANYQGIAGRNTLTAAGLGGFGGALDAGPDAASEGGASVGGSDAGSSEPEPCTVAFFSPLSADAGAIRLGGADDVDGEACGPSFTARITVLTNASTVTLFVNDNPLGVVAVSGGAVAIDATLGNRGDTGNTLRAEATLSDGRQCSAELPTSVFVDCPGPSCSIDEPRANRDGFLNQSQDADDQSEGLQTDIHVSTELDHVDQPVRLELDGDFDAVPGATVQADGAEGLATFAAVTLDEGVRTVRAECKDAFGALTLSPPIEWNVDISACTLELDSIASDANPITPAQDLDQNPGNGLDVLVRGSIEGNDCESIEIGQCETALAQINLRGLLGDDGGFLVPLKLGAQTASLSLCARVVDAAGNASSPDVTRDVDVRVDPPSVAIESPIGSTRYNRAGSGGALADGNPGSGSCEVDVAVNCSDVNVGVELLADGNLVATQPCVEQSGLPDPFLGRATFSAVSLLSKDDGAQTALSAQQSVSGLNAGVSASVQVQVDCNLPTCSFNAPDPGQTFLNASSDSSTDPGFQVTFDIATDAESAGRDVRLSFDGDPDNDRAAPAVASGGGAVATFANVPLSEAAHDVQAFCTDAAGNSASTAIETWTLDQTACTTSVLVASGHDPVVPNDDLDNVASNLQVSVSGLATGASCSAVRVGLCDSISGAFTDLDSGGGFTLEATLPSATASGLTVCAEIQDDAGNVTSQSALVNVRVDAPTVAFVSPTDGTHFNSTGGCTPSVVVSCSEDGSLVELLADGLSQGTHTCSGNLATFSVALLSKDDGATTELVAQENAQGVVSAPASIGVQADCNPPALSITQPVCNTQLALVGDDVNSGLAGLQVNVAVTNGGVPDVTLTVTAAGSTDIPGSSLTNTTSFSAVDLGGAGSVALRACATDPQGNQGCTLSCPLTIVGEPSISITNPRPPAVFTIEDDCDSDPDAGGLQISVQGTSDASDGSPVNVTVGTGSTATTTLSGGIFSACVPAPDGEDQLLTATVTDSGTGLSKSATVVVSTNTSPPPPIDAPTVAVTGRREGTLTLTWSSTLDASDDPLIAYLLRCSHTDITSEAIWDAATVIPVSVSPSPVAGIPQTQAVTNFRTGVERFCMVRGQDAYGQLSALTGTSPTVATVANPFLELEYNSVLPTTVTGTRVSVSAVGDIDGDGQNDFIYGTQGGGALIYFGGPGLDPTPDVTITPPAQGSSAEFGANVSGLGDINGDGRPDFAITSRFLTQPGASFGGSVFVFFGRLSTNPWPSSIAVAASPGCGADICFHSSETLAALGSSITATNFDGTGGADLIIGAQNRTGTDNVTQRVGRAYVILGGTQLDVPSGTIFSLPGATLSGFTIDPPSTASRNFGVNVAAVGLGSDASGDLVISSVGRNLGGETVNGEAFSVLGRAYTAGSGLQAVSAGTAFAVGTPNGFGNPMRALGDVNGDGLGDVWISTNFDLNGVDPVYLGRSSGFSGVSLLGFTNDVVDNEWAVYMATGFHTELGRLGDLDANGFDDVLVGSVFANGAPGTADLFYSDATTGSRSRSLADVRITSSGNGQMTPSFVGDIDGDSFRDFAILDSGLALGTPHLTLFY